MSYAALYKGTVPIIQLALGDGGDDDPVWTRPAWPPLADLTPTNNVFTGVYGVYALDSNFVSLLVATDSGTYTVDWGDGTTPDSGIASGVRADHTYDYASITASVVGDFKTVVVTVTSQGGNITTFNLQQKNPLNATVSESPVRLDWLDIAINASAMTSLIIGSSSSTLRLTALEQVKIYNHSITNMTSMFQSCVSLQSVISLNTVLVTDMTNMFNSCTSLTTVSLFNTSSVTTMNGMFNGCVSLQNVPLFNTVSVIDMTSMFQGCRSLKSVPLFNTSAVTNMTSMFQLCNLLQSLPLFDTSAVGNMNLAFATCVSLTAIPLFNTASVTVMTSTFLGCRNLRGVPLLNTASVIDMTSMFNACRSLKSVPLLDTSSVITMTSMFQGCISLITVPLFNTISVTSMSSMFRDCTSLTTVPLFNTASVTATNNMFNGCSSLSIIPPFNTAAVITTSLMFSTCPSLSQGRTNGLRYGISYSSCKLSAAALNDIFTGLGTASGAQTITITSNPGTTTCTKTIATAKGWTVSPP
jgi:surface protein